MRTTAICFAVRLAGCAAQCPPAPPPVVETRVIDSACKWLRPITFSAADTPETKEQIVTFEKARQKSCAPAGE